MKKVFLGSVVTALLLVACRKEEPIHGITYKGQEGYIYEGQDIVVGNEEIPSQLNVEGKATLEEGTVIGSDLNLNDKGIVVINGNTTIKNNANVTGDLFINDVTTVGTDFNLNGSGKIVIELPHDTMEVVVGNNMNVNDSLIILRGTLRIGTDFNINSTGVVNVGNTAKLIVEHDMGQSGRLHGNKNVTVLHTFNNNNAAGTFEEPLPNYEYPEN